MADNSTNLFENDAPPNLSPRRPRFSLLTLLLLTTIAALSVVVWRLGSEINPIRQELRLLREESGFLTIEDPTKIHAIALQELQSRKWTYRVYLPTGRNYFVACKINDLPLGGVLPKLGTPPGISTISAEKGNMTAMGLDPGEYLITLAVHKGDQGDWQCRLNCRSSNTSGDKQRDMTGGRSFSTDDQWPAREGAFSSGGVSKQMSVIASDKPIVLLDMRSFEDNARSSENSIEGAMLWIEPIP